MTEEKVIEFSKLRHAYIVVKNFLEEESRENVKSLSTKIAEDLSLYGDDNYELLVKFIDKFEVEHSEFDYGKHFHSEGEIADPTIALFNLLTLSVWLPMKTLELLTLNKIKLPKPKFHSPERKVSDMKFKELLTWYIEGEYKTDVDIKYVFKNGI